MRTVSHQRTGLRVMDHEQRLIERAKDGDQSGFEELILKYDRDILALSLRLLGNREEAKDAYQETFLKVFSSIGRFRQQSSFSTWIFRMATQVCIDRLRQRKKSGEEESIEGDRSKCHAPLKKVLPSSRCQNNPERVLDALRLRECISRALNTLSTEERLVFELKHYQGLKLKQIAEMTGSRESTLRDCLYRAIWKLKAELTADPNCGSLFNGHMTEYECALAKTTFS